MQNIESGNISLSNLYMVVGEKNVVYDGLSYATGQTFRGVDGITDFTFEGDGTELLIELLEFKAGSISFVQGYNDISFLVEATGIKGMSIGLELTDAEKIVNEVTTLKGMSLELLDYPFYSYFINETRFSFNPD